jgi:hypothetical protein
VGQVSYALGQPVTLGPWLVRDSAGALANATTATLTITLPDGTTATPTVTNPPSVTGTYVAAYTPTLPGLYGVRIVFGGTNAQAPPLDSFYVDQVLPPLCSLAEAREQCRAYSTGDDVLLQRYVRVASGHCERRTQVWRRQALATTKDGGSTLVRLRYPIISVTTVTEGGTAVDSATGYTAVLEDGLLYRGPSTSCGLRWAAGRQNVAVTYVAGAADGLIPDEIRQGVLMLVEHLWNTQRGGSGLPRKNSDSDWSLPAGFTLPNAVRERWEPWIREQVA